MALIGSSGLLEGSPTRPLHSTIHKTTCMWYTNCTFWRSTHQKTHFIKLHVCGVPIALFGTASCTARFHSRKAVWVFWRGSVDDTTVVPLLNMIFKLRAVLSFCTVLVPCLACNGQLRILGTNFTARFQLSRRFFEFLKEDLPAAAGVKY